MDDAVLCMGFSRDSEMLVTGSKDGKIKVSCIHNSAIIDAFSTEGSKLDAYRSGKFKPVSVFADSIRPIPKALQASISREITATSFPLRSIH